MIPWPRSISASSTACSTDAVSPLIRDQGENLSVGEAPTLSLCMIVKNEEFFLADCLSQARDHVDEIILVDTGSTDATQTIARQFTDKVYEFSWVDDFAAADLARPTKDRPGRKKTKRETTEKSSRKKRPEAGSGDEDQPEAQP